MKTRHIVHIILYDGREGYLEQQHEPRKMWGGKEKK